MVSPRNFLLVLTATCSLLMAGLVGCASARPRKVARAQRFAEPAKPPKKVAQPVGASTSVKKGRPGGAMGTEGGPASLAVAAVSPMPPAPASAPVRPEPTVDQRAGLRRLLAEELAAPELTKVGISLVVRELGPDGKVGEELFAQAPDKARVPASNAKLLSSVAALELLPAHHHFVTEVARRGSRIYLRGTGDPLLHERDLVALARAAKARGVRSVRHVVVDDSYFGRRQLAPGFEQFLAGSSYRPTHGALNLAANAIQIRVSAPRGRRRPRVDVLPPSDYVKVKKRVRFARARRGKAAKLSRVRVEMRPRGSILWLTISGVIGRQSKPYVSWRAVYDPALNAGWAFRRALKRQGIRVSGIVTRGRMPKGARVLARRSHSLSAVLQVTNRDSHNLAAETLIRTMGKLGGAATSGRGKGWDVGLARATAALRKLGLRDVHLENGSGLHRGTKVSAADLVRLLAAVWERPAWRRRLLPTLAVAGRSGTLGGRMRGTAAAGVVHAKTGTLGSVLALSGFVLPEKPPTSQPSTATQRHPLAFSLLVNGSARRRVRRRMDRIAVLLARYARGERLATEQPAPPADVKEQPTTDAPPAEGASKGKQQKQPKRRRIATPAPKLKVVLPPPTALTQRPTTIAPIPPLPELP